MNRSLILVVTAVAMVVVTAVALRISEAPYIAFAEGRRSEATDGLRKKASGGDSFAAFLVASNYERGILGTPDLALASDWYQKAARLGEARSIVPYINLNTTSPQSPEQCRSAIALLDAAGRSGDAVALISLGRRYEKGICTQPDLVTSARYYMGAAKIDRQFNKSVEAIVAQLDPHTAQGLRALPEEFDLDAKGALTQFLAALPLTGTK